MVMILNITKATIFANSWLGQVKAYKFNRVSKGRIGISFTSNYPAFNLNWRNFINQLHRRFLACILHPLGGVVADLRGNEAETSGGRRVPR
uniref:Uncharacterized protein n=1 Tax=Glycine max TaxID=3847 RepID=C6T1J9_SOYBN|nr:unknown [Glycine max]